MAYLLILILYTYINTYLIIYAKYASEASRTLLSTIRQVSFGREVALNTGGATVTQADTDGATVTQAGATVTQVGATVTQVGVVVKQVGVTVTQADAVGTLVGATVTQVTLYEDVRAHVPRLRREVLWSSMVNEVSPGA